MSFKPNLLEIIYRDPIVKYYVLLQNTGELSNQKIESLIEYCLTEYDLLIPTIGFYSKRRLLFDLLPILEFYIQYTEGPDDRVIFSLSSSSSSVHEVTFCLNHPQMYEDAVEFFKSRKISVDTRDTFRTASVLVLYV